MNPRCVDGTTDVSNRDEEDGHERVAPSVDVDEYLVDNTTPIAQCVSEPLPDLPSYASASVSTSTYPQQQQHDLLTIFQAAPLVYLDNTTGDFQTLPLLNFDYERHELTKAIEEASVLGDGSRKIEVDFQIATVDRMSAFLASEKGQIMHFSCHGNPRYLVLEDGRGAMQALRPDELKEWITLGGQNLQFVFVSACHSSFIGQAFIDAGVPHVVCCRHDTTILETAAVEFEKIFYRNLACGTKNLQQAFDIARHEILVNPRIPTKNRAEEASKFCLLPHNGCHDVPIFFQNHHHQHGSPNRRRKQYIPHVTFPPPPQIHLGRQMEQFKLIQSIQVCRLVRVSGPVGVGKNDLVKTCCQYLSDRLHLLDIHEILWVTYTSQPTRRESEHRSGRFDQIFHLVRDASVSVEAFTSETRDAVLNLMDDCYTRKLLLIIDAKELTSQESATKMGVFVTVLLDGTRHVQILIIHRDTVCIKTDRLSYMQEDVRIDPLSVEDTVDLFGILFPRHLIDTERHGINSVDELKDVLLSSSTDLSTQRMKEIYKMLGNGIPLDIHRSSRNFSAEDIDKLVALARHCMHSKDLNISSRAALTKRQKQVEEEIAEAAASRDFVRCQQLKSVLTELEVQKQRLPDLPSLERDLEETAFKLAIAASSMEFEDALRLNKELKRLEECIRLERQTGVAKSKDPFESEIMTTRAALEAKIWQLDNDYDSAFDGGYFDTAEKIVDESNRLKELRSSHPTKSELSQEMRGLESDLGAAKESRRLDAARMISMRLCNVRTRLKMEEEAEAALGMSASDVQTQLNRETEAQPPPTDIDDRAKTSNGPILERNRQPGTRTTMDPPGEPPSPIDQAMQQQDITTPGAFRIGGESGSDCDLHGEPPTESSRVPSLSSDQRGNEHKPDTNQHADFVHMSFSGSVVGNSQALPPAITGDGDNDSVASQSDMSAITTPAALMQHDELRQGGKQNERSNDRNYSRARMNQSALGSFPGRENAGQWTEKESASMRVGSRNRTQQTAAGETNMDQEDSQRVSVPDAECVAGINSNEVSGGDDASTPGILEAFLVNDGDVNTVFPGQIRMEHIAEQTAIEQIIMDTIKKNTVSAQVVMVENDLPAAAAAPTAASVDGGHSEQVCNDDAEEEDSVGGNFAPSQSNKSRNAFKLGKMFKRWNSKRK
jgi:hypothetical protein